LLEIFDKAENRRKVAVKGSCRQNWLISYFFVPPAQNLEAFVFIGRMPD